MGIGDALIGIGAGILSALLKPDTWTLINKETGDPISGDFPHEDMGREVTNNYAQINSINRQAPILQFVNGSADKFTLKSRFFYRDIMDTPPVQKLEQIIAWARIDPLIRRPPVLTLVVGTGADVAFDVVLDGVTGITYSKATFLGDIREVTFTLSLTRYTPFSLDDAQATDTRYARARERDYYELLAWEEYRNPMLGVIIQQRHPRQLVVVPGAIVKLPSIEGIRTDKPRPSSVVLVDAFSKKDTAGRRARIQTLDRLARPYVSFIANITPRR